MGAVIRKLLGYRRFEGLGGGQGDHAALRGIQAVR